jgi:predicted nucleotidyltransferase
MSDPPETRAPGGETVARALAGQPALRAAFTAVVERIRAVPGRAVAVHGSVARGTVDRFSDLDLVVWAAPDEEPAAVVAAVERIVAGLGDVVVSFRGTHVGRPNLAVTYSIVAGDVVKTDIEVLPPGVPADVEVLVPVHGDPPAPADAPEGAGPAPDALAAVLSKAAGWTWFSYAKIARGEYFAAARAIDFTREHALLPALLFQHDLPQDGHRHVEARLPAGVVARLRRSYPGALEPAELLRALDQVTAYLCTVADELAAALPSGEGHDARDALVRMREIVAADGARPRIAGGPPEGGDRA